MFEELKRLQENYGVDEAKWPLACFVRFEMDDHGVKREFYYKFAENLRLPEQTIAERKETLSRLKDSWTASAFFPEVEEGVLFKALSVEWYRPVTTRQCGASNTLAYDFYETNKPADIRFFYANGTKVLENIQEILAYKWVGGFEKLMDTVEAKIRGFLDLRSTSGLRVTGSRMASSAYASSLLWPTPKAVLDLTISPNHGYGFMGLALTVTLFQGGKAFEFSYPVRAMGDWHRVKVEDIDRIVEQFVELFRIFS